MSTGYRTQKDISLGMMNSDLSLRNSPLGSDTFVLVVVVTGHAKHIRLEILIDTLVLTRTSNR